MLLVAQPAVNMWSLCGERPVLESGPSMRSFAGATLSADADSAAVTKSGINVRVALTDASGIAGGSGACLFCRSRVGR